MTPNTQTHHRMHELLALLAVPVEDRREKRQVYAGQDGKFYLTFSGDLPRYEPFQLHTVKRALLYKYLRHAYQPRLPIEQAAFHITMKGTRQLS